MYNFKKLNYIWKIDIYKFKFFFLLYNIFYLNFIYEVISHNNNDNFIFNVQ